jgi:hypothetical protein
MNGEYNLRAWFWVLVSPISSKYLHVQIPSFTQLIKELMQQFVREDMHKWRDQKWGNFETKEIKVENILKLIKCN